MTSFWKVILVSCLVSLPLSWLLYGRSISVKDDALTIEALRKELAEKDTLCRNQSLGDASKIDNRDRQIEGCERGQRTLGERLDECNQHLGELITHKCDACKIGWYEATTAYEPKVMWGPGRVVCPPDTPIMWVDPDYGIGGDWAFICTPKLKGAP
jgi:hypothetical protein